MVILVVKTPSDIAPTGLFNKLLNNGKYIQNSVIYFNAAEDKVEVEAV